MIRNHERAALAHKHVSAVAERVRQANGGEDKLKVAYGAISHKLPILVHNEGLAVALHFVAGRDEGKRLLLGHLAEQLQAGDHLKGKTDQDLLRAVREADLARTQTLTREIQRCLDWYKRFAKTVLKISGTEETGAEESK